MSLDVLGVYRRFEQSLSTGRLSLPGKRVTLETGFDVVCICASFVGAHLLRFGDLRLPAAPISLAYLLPVVILLKVSIFRIFRLYRGLWTHAGTPEAVRLLRASSTASGGLLVVLVGLRGAGSVPIAILILDWMLTTATTGGGRFGIRALYRVRASNSSDETRILIYGADAYGVLLLRYLRHDVSTTWTVAGFVDPDKCGRRLRGLPVVETPDAGAAAHLAVPVPCSADATLQRDYAQIADEYAPQEVACHRFEMAVGDPSCPAASGGSEAPRGSTTKRQTPSPET